jgi:hypothetical protein
LPGKEKAFGGRLGPQRVVMRAIVEVPIVTDVPGEAWLGWVYPGKNMTKNW